MAEVQKTTQEQKSPETKKVSTGWGSVPSREIALFCRQMALVLHSDITVMEGVLILIEQTEHSILKSALQEIYRDMEQGLPFGQAFDRHRGTVFPVYLSNMVIIGETSGTNDVVFAQMADYYEKDYKVRNKVKSAITYPAILTGLMLCIIALLIVKILPMFNDILLSMGGQMPTLTQGMMSFSTFISGNLLLVLIVLVVLIVGVMLFSRSASGRRFGDKAKVTLPLFKAVFRRVVTARFARSLAILLKSGVSLLAALEMMETLIDNSYVEEQFKRTRQSIDEGEELPKSLAQASIFPPLFLRLVSVGQRTGFLDEMLARAADIFDEEVDGALERLTTFIEPTIIIILSIVVGVILLSVMLPMISIMNAIG